MSGRSIKDPLGGSLQAGSIDRSLNARWAEHFKRVVQKCNYFISLFYIVNYVLFYRYCYIITDIIIISGMHVFPRMWLLL